MYDKFLPIGTIVLLKGAKKRIMITGFYITSQNVVYDYTGCVYPEGYISRDKMLLFNHNQIDKIYYIGPFDQEEKQFKQKLNNAITKFNNKFQNINNQSGGNV